MAAEIVGSHDVARGRCRLELVSDVGETASLLMEPSRSQGASIRSTRRAAMTVVVFQWPHGWPEMTHNKPLRFEPQNRVNGIFRGRRGIRSPR